MKRCRKNLVTMFLVILTLQQLSGCYYHGTPDATRMYAPYCIVSQTVPFADNLHTHQWDKVSFVEKDTFGRTYYIYQTPSIILGYEIEIHVICQGELDGREYGYYEDACYMIRGADDISFSEDEIAEFKIKNHWNQLIVPEKVKYTTYESHNLQIANQSEMDLAISQWFEIDNKFSFNCNALEVYDDKQLFFVAIDNKFYLISYHKNSNPPIIFCEEIKYSLSPQEEIRAAREHFKELQ